jgi:hypothetical protein
MSSPKIDSTSGSEKEVARHEPGSATAHVMSTESSTNAPKAPDPLPNGGLTAWLQVLGCFMLYFNTWSVRTSKLLHGLD